MPKTKSKAEKKPVKMVSKNVHKQVLTQVHEVFHNDKNGFTEICKSLNIPIQAPREKITVMIVGNHSAGKSSFVNWYIDQTIQKESMAMETSGFTFVTCGRKRNTLKGPATIKHLNFIEGIQKFEGVMEHLQTEVVDSKARNFTMVDFIDTPGLTDGKLQYQYDVNEILGWLSDKVDLIFVFFDPHGGATCERTMDVVKHLHKHKTTKHKVHYFLSKADTIRTEKERLKVLSQVSQGLSGVVANEGGQSDKFYGEHALEVKSIYRPDKDQDIEDENDYNQINEIVELINLTIHQNVQQHCQHMQNSCSKIQKTIDTQLLEQNVNESCNQTLHRITFALWTLAFAIPFILMCYVFHFIEALMPAIWKKNEFLQTVLSSIKTVSSVANLIDDNIYRYHMLVVLFVIFSVFLVVGKFLWGRSTELLNRSQVRKRKQWREHVTKLLSKNGLCDTLWSLYLEDSTAI